MSRRALLPLLAAFVVSVAVRWPLLDRPLSAHHEYCTAFTLIALTNWWEDGWAAHHGVPSGGFVREGGRLYPHDRFNSNERAVGLYYFSHPPLAYDIPYLLFRLLGRPPDAAGLQWMNIFFHMVTAIVLCRIVHGATGEEQAGMYAAVVYLLLPVTLWFHGNAYMSDMFVQVPWVVHLAFAMHVLAPDVRPSAGALAGYAFSLFLVLSTSWLGVFAAMAGVCVAVFRRWREGRPWPVIGITALALVAAAGCTALRFLQVIDGDALLRHYASRFAVRGSLGAHPLPLLEQVAVNYRIGLLPVILLLAILSVIVLVRERSVPRPPPRLRLFIALAGLPVLFDHLVLLQYAAHDFAALKAAPLLCGLAGWGLVRIVSAWRPIATVLTSLAAVLYFYRTNPLPGHDAGRYHIERDLGLFIAANADPDEVVFGSGITTEPQVAWYARRNVLGVAGEQAALEVLEDRGLERGVLITSRNGALVATHLSRSPLIPAPAPAP